MTRDERGRKRVAGKRVRPTSQQPEAADNRHRGSPEIKKVRIPGGGNLQRMPQVMQQRRKKKSRRASPRRQRALKSQRVAGNHFQIQHERNQARGN